MVRFHTPRITPFVLAKLITEYIQAGEHLIGAAS